jgi:hypothetical protein
VAFKTASATHLTVDKVMAAWGAYVKQFHPPVKQEQAVLAAYLEYQSAMAEVTSLGAVWAQLASSGQTNAPPDLSQRLDQAKALSGQAFADLVGLVQSFGIKI